MLRLTLKTSLCNLLFASALAAPTAHAHIDMMGALMDRGGSQKVGACGGLEWGAGPVYTFAPGAVIKLELQESLAHDGYFRIAFDDVGDDSFVDPISIDPVNPNRYGTGKKCADDPADHCGKSDFCSFVSHGAGPTVLWDNLDAHLADGVQTRSWNVKLPDVECEHCTIQVMQVMEDPVDLGIVQLHGPFDGADDLYFRCIDVVLKRGTPPGPGTTTAPIDNQGMECAPAGPVDAGMPTMTDAGTRTPDAAIAVTVDASAASAPRDAGSAHGDHVDDDDAPTGERAPDAGAARDASSARDAKVSAEDTDAKPTDTSSEGCNVANAGTKPHVAGFFGALALLGLILRRRTAAARPIRRC